MPRKFGPTESLTVEETFQKGLGEEKFGLLDDAERSYDAALAKDRQFAPAHLRLGLLALDRVELRKGMEHFRQVLERDPASGESHYYLAVANAELGNVSEARRHFFLLLPSSAKFDLRDYCLALLALQEKDFKEAERRISSAIATIPSDLSVREAYAYLLRKLGTLRRPKTTGGYSLSGSDESLPQAELLLSRRPRLERRESSGW